MKNILLRIFVFITFLFIIAFLIIIITDDSFPQMILDGKYAYKNKTFPDTNIVLPYGSIVIGRNVVAPNKLKVFYLEPIPDTLKIEDKSQYLKTIKIFFYNNKDSVVYNLDSLDYTFLLFKDSSFLKFYSNKSHDYFYKNFYKK